MTWIKICGITNLEDALIAVDAGADALGFVFYKKSPRYIAPEAVSRIVPELPKTIDKVGVIVDIHPADFLGILGETGLTSCQMQLCDSTPAMPQAREFVASTVGFNLYRSIPARWFIDDEKRMRDFATAFTKLERGFVSPEQGKRLLEHYRTIFLDSGTPQQPGGTGRTFDWSRATGVFQYLQPNLRVVVAGGLTPDNVVEAMRILHPWGVDVSSGVEASPGKKDPEKVRTFIKAVREADKANSRN